MTGDAEMFQKIKKAHDALTDPVVKENYRLYGNPDGRQALEVSIGLPNFLKGGVSGWALLLIYVVGLVVAIPMAACRFYKRNKDKDSSTGLHNGTLFWLSHRLSTFPEGTQVRLMPEIIGGCLEPVLEHPQAKDETTGGNPILHPAIKELLVACRREELFTDITPSDPSKNRNRFLIPREYVTRHALLLLAHCNKQKLAAAGALKGMTKDLLIVQLGLLKSLGKLCDLMVQMGVELEANGERKVAMMVARGEVPPNMRPQPNRYFDAIKNILHFQQLVSGDGAGVLFVVASSRRHASHSSLFSFFLPAFFNPFVCRSPKACGRTTRPCACSSPRPRCSRSTPRKTRAGTNPRPSASTSRTRRPSAPCRPC